MNKATKWIAGPIAGLLTLVGGGVGYLYAAFPIAADAPEKQVAATDALKQRGAYLAEHVAVCVDCHSERDFGLFTGPSRPGTRGAGGERFGHEVGVAGNVYSRNITPAALGDWTDGELIRAMTTGVSRDGTALFPIMPYLNYGHLCERDVDAIVTYVRGLEPVPNQVPERELDFPLNLIVRTLPTAAAPVACPEPSDGVRYGEYLTTMASCGDCHTPRKNNAPDPDKLFAGGAPMPLPNGSIVRPANLTPHATGLGSWTKEAFVQRFRSMAQPNVATPVSSSSFNTVMPWTMYAGMTEQDLGAIYDYLRTLPPVENRVEKFTPAP